MYRHRPALLFSLSLFCACFLPGRPGVSQASSSDAKTRTLTFKAAPGQPAYTIHVSTTGPEGVVKVVDGFGSLVQTLTCSLDQSQLEWVSKEFVARFTAEDLDMDGYLDLRSTREFAAKWGRDCIWLYDPKNHIFEKGLLAEQMELLYNLTVAPKRHRIISYSIGPVNPLWDEYRIEYASKDRPYWPRLIPVQSCFIETGAVGLETSPLHKNSTIVVTRFEKNRSVVERHPLGSEEVRGACDSFSRR